MKVKLKNIYNERKTKYNLQVDQLLGSVRNRERYSI